MISKEIDRILPKVQKPSRYTGGETNIVIKDKKDAKVRFAFCFPDSYEVGMSHLGMKILYELLNSNEDIWCERVFAPWPDMEAEMRKANIPLFALESGDTISDFDFIGFTLQYELSYTNILNMLDLAGIPILAKDRKGLYPLVIGGGPCAVNSEPIADFFDIFLIGEAEEILPKLMDLYIEAKKNSLSKQEFLKLAVKLDGIYIPSFYDVEYNEDSTIKKIVANISEAPAKVKKAIISDLDNVFYPQKFVVPLTEIVHDRVMLEIFRGCIRGCRFCQGGMLYRPYREKLPENLLKYAKTLCENTGYEEISLTSLSTSDYSHLESLVRDLLPWANEKKINLSLPSLRIDNFPNELLNKIQEIRKSGLTFAPEAGTARLRDAINKNITEEEILNACETAFKSGRTSVKLYFMIGLPTETDEDVVGIAILAQKIVDLFYNLKNKPRGKSVNVTISVSTFVPKPFTPFQWEAQDDIETILRKQKLLRDSIKTKKVALNWHDAETSYLEAVFARGDRRLAKVIERAFWEGCKFDSWSEFFKFDVWMNAFKKENISPEFYANRKISFDEILPWEHIDIGVAKKFLIKEAKKAYKNQSTPNCSEKCSGCGADTLIGGACDVKR